MPKKSSISQPNFFKREVPQMPEGYYSSGPNPNLAKFVEENSTPYDPLMDTYDVPPFDKPITTTKATAIYNMHTYWSKKPHDAIQQYIRHYTQPGDLVLDPFCGSGGTALAALMEGRKAIAIDLSPAATFITKNYCTPVDVDELQSAFEELKAKVKPEMDWLYETRCDRCDGRATTAYTVYSQVFQCPRCLEKVPLFDCPEVKSQTQAGKEKMIRVCPHCKERGVEEEISTRSKKFGAIPVLVSYLCEEGCKPARGERRHNDPNPKKRGYFEKYDLAKIKEIESKDIPYWYPKNRMMNVESDTAPWGDEWREGRNFRIVNELFTKSNLWALALIFNYCNNNSNDPLYDAILFCWSSILLNVTKMTTNRDRMGHLAGTYYLPAEYRCPNVIRSLSFKFNMMLNGWKDLQKIRFTNVSISTQSALNLESIASNTLDYIFADPPYSGTIQYGELNFIWEAWLGFDTYWHKNEIIVNNTRDQTMDDWAEMMNQALLECYRVLKPGRWISLCYHDTSEGTWQLLQDVMAEMGFIVEKLDNALFIDTGGTTFNQNNAEKVTKRDLVINFRKPRPGELTASLLLTGDEDASTFREKATGILIESLERRPGQTADTIYDELVSRMVRKGSFERHNFDELLRSVAEPSTLSPGRGVGGEGTRWYLLESAAGVDEAEARRKSSAARKLETSMATFLKSHPEEAGVHYSDLFESYLPISDKPRRLLQEWLPEFFFKTEEGTWRPPQTNEEREQKAMLRTTGELRKIKRFVNALNEGVPPGEKDKPANAATLAEWIYQCRRAGLYDVGKTLYEKGGLRFDALTPALQVQVEEDYQICAKRGSEKKEPDKGKRKAKRDEGTIPMDLSEF